MLFFIFLLVFLLFLFLFVFLLFLPNLFFLPSEIFLNSFFVLLFLYFNFFLLGCLQFHQSFLFLSNLRFDSIELSHLLFICSFFLFFLCLFVYKLFFFLLFLAFLSLLTKGFHLKFHRFCPFFPIDIIFLLLRLDLSMFSPPSPQKLVRYFASVAFLDNRTLIFYRIEQVFHAIGNFLCD